MSNQILSVQTFADSGPNSNVNAERLNSHVDDASLLNGAIINQAMKTVGLAADVVLMGDSTVGDTGAPYGLPLGDLLLQGQRDGTQRWGGTAGGSANALTVATSPPSTGAYFTGEYVRFKIATVNTGASTINLDGRGVANLYSSGGVALGAGALPTGAVVEAVYDGAEFQVTSMATGNATVASVSATEAFRGDVQQYSPATGTSGTNTILVAPLNSAGAATYTALADGMVVRFIAVATNTGAVTLAVNGLTAHPIVSPANAALLGGEIRIGQMVQVIYDLPHTQFVMIAALPAAFTATAGSAVGNGNQTFAHSLGRTPTKVRAVFICTTNQTPWVVNDELDFANIFSNAGVGQCSFWANATNVVTSINDNTKLQSSTNGLTILTPTSWKIKVYAEV